MPRVPVARPRGWAKHRRGRLRSGILCKAVHTGALRWGLALGVRRAGCGGRWVRWTRHRTERRCRATWGRQTHRHPGFACRYGKACHLLKHRRKEGLVRPELGWWPEDRCVPSLGGKGLTRLGLRCTVRAGCRRKGHLVRPWRCRIDGGGRYPDRRCAGDGSAPLARNLTCRPRHFRMAAPARPAGTKRDGMAVRPNGGYFPHDRARAGRGYDGRGGRCRDGRRGRCSGQCLRPGGGPRNECGGRRRYRGGGRRDGNGRRGCGLKGCGCGGHAGHCAGPCARLRCYPSLTAHRPAGQGCAARHRAGCRLGLGLHEHPGKQLPGPCDPRARL